MTITKELCQKLAHYVYGGDALNSLADKLDYKRTEVGVITNNENYFKDITTGCAAAFYYNKALNEGVIAYRGTERPGLGELWSVSLPDLKDWKADASLMMNKVPDQFNSAKYFYEQVKKAYPDATLGFTGHSLGGALASLVAVKAGSYPTFTFNAPGVRHLLNNPSIGLPLDGNYNAITNYSVMNDWCGMVNSHIGKLYIFPPQSMRKLVSSSGLGVYAPFIDTHEWILGANLSKAVSKPVGFNESEGLSLWYYDANNYVNNKVTNSTLRPLVQEIIARVSVESLENALKILRNNPNLIEHDFTYKVGGKTYYLPKANGKTITGTTNAEVLFGSSNNDILQGNSGNDEIYGFEGNDTIKGGSGNDILYAGEGNNNLSGDVGNDTLYGGFRDDELIGGSGNDVLDGGYGRNSLKGGTGYDLYITGSYANDTISDSDGRGVIKYDGKFLIDNPKKIIGEENKWFDKYGNIFEYVSSNLIVNNNLTIKSFKNGDLNITLLKEDGTPEPSIPGSSGSGDGNEGGEGSGSGSGSGGGSGSGSGNSGTGESNYDHDDSGNLITSPNPNESNATYEIMPGDTIWGILAALGLGREDYEELIRLNPWLAERFSDDMEYCLIRPGEILILPKGKGAVKIEEDGEHEALQPKPVTTPDKDISDAGPANNPPVDPLIFDLDFNNIISLSKPENGRNFDIDNNGIAQKVA